MNALANSRQTADSNDLHPPEDNPSSARLPPDMIQPQAEELAGTSLTAALEKKHTFDCAELTRGGLCDC